MDLTIDYATQEKALGCGNRPPPPSTPQPHRRQSCQMTSRSVHEMTPSMRDRAFQQKDTPCTLDDRAIRPLARREGGPAAAWNSPPPVNLKPFHVSCRICFPRAFLFQARSSISAHALPPHPPSQAQFDGDDGDEGPEPKRKHAPGISVLTCGLSWRFTIYPTDLLYLYCPHPSH